jgi:hypothetical protein
MATRDRYIFFTSFLLAAAALTACGDPGGPELSGTIHLASSVDPTSFTTLQVRVYPDPGGTFDPHAIPSTAESDVRDSKVTFPYGYSLGEPLGTTPNPSWRVVAWLSHQPASASSVLPQKGDLLCTAVGTIKGCGTYGDYCGTTSGVDCTLATPVQ